MNKKTISVGVMALLIVASLVAYSPTTDSATSTNAVRWEYTMHYTGKTDLEAFNKLGAEGWELVGAGGSNVDRWIFKRRLP